MKKIIYCVLVVLVATSCKVGRFVYYNFANITDHKIFPARTINNDSSSIFHFKDATSNNLRVKLRDDTRSFETYLEENETVAFLVIQNDTIKYEKYLNKYSRESIVASFSMAKSFTSFLIGCAIEDNLINSVNDPVTRYLPDLKYAEDYQNVTIENLLLMTSGIDFNESYTNPFGDAATFYYGKTLKKSTLKLKTQREPNIRMQYVSGNTQLLGLILDQVLDEKTISQYLQEKLWTKVGMEFEASWSIDKERDGMEKTFCCLNARAIDFAKFGRLYLNKGNWEGEQLISESWVDNSTKVDTLNGSKYYYQYQWWLPNQDGDFIAEGILGQFIYVSPSDNLIIVRLGKKYGDVNWEGTFEKIKEILRKTKSPKEA